MNPNKRITMPLVAALLAATLPLAAIADVTHAAWQNGKNFNFKMNHMPDFDQSRAFGGGAIGLPGNGGTFCVPTSAMNVMAYIANHGFPNLQPGKADWQSQSQYLPSGLAIMQMGQFMGTDLSGGTGGQGGVGGLKSWLHDSNAFTVTSYSASGNYAPRLKDLAASALNGGLVMLCYGRYKVTGSFGGIPIIDRDGGHCTTLTRAAAGGSSQIAWVRDPASPNDGQLWDQSWFENRTLILQDQFVTTGASPWKIKNMAAINYDSGKSKNAYLDRYYCVRPKAGYSLVNIGSELKLKIHFPVQVLGYGGPDTKDLLWPHLAQVLDVVLGPDQNQIFVLSDPVGTNGDTIHTVDLLSGEVVPVMAMPGATSLTFGRKRSLYALRPGLLHKIDLEQIPPGIVTKITPVVADAFAFEDGVDEVVLISSASGKVVRYPHHLDAKPTQINFPAGIPAGVAPSVAIDPTTGKLWLVDPVSGKLFGFNASSPTAPANLEVVSLPAIQSPTSIDTDDQGHLFVSANHQVAEVVFSSGTWKVNSTSPFNGLATGDTFRVSRSRTNYDPFEMSFPRWRNLTPADLAALPQGGTVPDCAGDASVDSYGQGKPGHKGLIPALVAVDLPVPGMKIGLELSSATPGTLPILFLGASPAALPFDGGTLLVNPSVIWPYAKKVPSDGELTLYGAFPANANFCGLQVFAQIMYADKGGTGFYKTAQTNGVALTIGS